ncbi:AGAP007370-PA-like protein [Anopheles sinensis]|uniref:AGAP007370-PA-like protein n=1 Tax=Anopheles sinensis TaxID=74873 RepID=A0A084WN16_ANOSI|nr:AGAP007370-PA-like protein [Anopheles sinensis]
MKTLSVVCFGVILVGVLNNCAANFGTVSFDYDTVINFLVYDWNKNTFADQGTLETNFDAFGCKVTDPFVVVVHGWKEGCSNTQWVRDTLNNFVLKRKGCILCINYATIANIDYSKAVEQVDAVARTLEKKVRQLFTFGLTPENGMLYAFSLGAHVAFQAGRNLGTQKLARIDACDPVWLGFDLNSTYTALSVMDSATSVQCIHTSTDYGTSRRVCHKDWLMGYCGWFQFAAGTKSSHGLCPEFYNAAFWFDFPAISNPYYCPTTRAVSSWPSGFKMGYFMPQTSFVGDLFARTSTQYPYN